MLPAMPSFDVVSKVDLMELDNALNTAEKELAQRYDFRGTNTHLERTPEGIILRSSDEEHVKATYRVLQEPDKAKIALGDARRTFASDPAATKRLDDLAHELGLQG